MTERGIDIVTLLGGDLIMFKVALSAVAAALVLTVAAPLAFAQSSEYDSKPVEVSNETTAPTEDLTVILRTNPATGASEQAFIKGAKPANETEAQALISKAQFTPVEMADKPVTKSEYDQQSSKAAFYGFVRGGYFGGYAYPVFRYGFYRPYVIAPPLVTYPQVGYGDPNAGYCDPNVGCDPGYQTLPPCYTYAYNNISFAFYNSVGWGWPGYGTILNGFYGYRRPGLYFGGGGWSGGGWNGNNRYYGRPVPTPYFNGGGGRVAAVPGGWGGNGGGFHGGHR